MIPEPSSLAAFVVATVVLLVIPGPAVLYVVARSADQGPRAGVVSTLGIGVGTLVHVLAASLGISALLVSSALAFNVVKILGAAYLVYLGVRRLVDREPPDRPEIPRRRRMLRIFFQGMVVNILNPKTALFFFAFLPQFVDVSRGSVSAQIAFLGLLFVALGVVSDSTWALAAGTAGNWLRSPERGLSPRGLSPFWRTQRYLTGGVLIALGVTAVLSGSGEE